MAFIVLHPGTNDNPSGKYRVVDAEDWTRYRNGATRSYTFLAFDTFEGAEAARDVANVDLARGEKPF